MLLPVLCQFSAPVFNIVDIVAPLGVVRVVPRVPQPVRKWAPGFALGSLFGRAIWKRGTVVRVRWRVITVYK